MAKKGSWKGGNAPAQGNTPRRVSRPVEGTKKFVGKMKTGAKNMTKKGSAKVDGRRRGGKK